MRSPLSPPRWLDPTFDTHSLALFAYNQMFDTLAVADDKGDLQGALIVSWRVRSDKLGWQFKFRQSVKFHNRVDRAVAAESALSFLGLGAEPRTPSWGGMLADRRAYLGTGWWLAAMPGVAIMLTVLSINPVGDWLRDTLEPQLRA